MCIFVIKVKFDNVDLMTLTEERMIMKSTASSIYIWNAVTLKSDGRIHKILIRYH